MTNEPRAGKAIDPETLAAYIDKRLSPDERAVVEAQLATDRESYELLVELMKAEDELGDVASAPAKATPAPVVPMPPRVSKTRRWIVAGGGLLAAAAALVLVVRLQPDLLQRLRGGEAVDPQLAKLVAAVGEERYVEARLSGGFRYGPLRSMTRGPGDLSQQNLALLAAAADVERSATDSTPPASLHVLGVSRILTGEFDAGIAALEEAAKLPAAPATVLVDLSAGYLARAAEASSREDLQRAFDAADRATRVAPELPEAFFNRALAAELLGMPKSIAYWQEAVERTPASGWRDHAARRLASLTAPAP